MVRSMTSATATARPVLTTSPPVPDAPSFAGVDHPFLSLRGREAAEAISWHGDRHAPSGLAMTERSVIARPASFLSLRGRGAAEAISWHGDRHAPSGLAMTERSVIARPASFLSLRGRGAAEAISS